MEFPTLNPIAANQSVIEQFLGYNRNLRAGDGEWYDMENLSSDNYPVMSTRKKRRKYAVTGERITGMIAKEGLCWTAGSRFWHNGVPYNMGLTDGEKQMVGMGAYVIILPDRKWINTIDHQYGNIENSVHITDGATMRLSTIEGDDPEVTYVGDEEPEEPENGMVWLDTSTTPHSLKKYSSSQGIWVAIATTYVRIDAPGIGKGFEINDGVSIEGLTESEYEDVRNLGTSAILYNRGDDFIVIIGVLDEIREVTTPFRISRKMPELDFITESNNRLWGCRYGQAANGDIVNEIYACKLGDFKNWNCYMGISTDSYTVSIGSDGPWTGAITHNGYPCFFKEGMLHKIYGQIPANFQVQSTACRGVQQGSSKSMAIVNEVLFYLGTGGVCAYDGSIPGEVSSQFGGMRYHAGIAAAAGNKYYLRALDAADNPVVFVYDSARRMWHKENDFGIRELCSYKGDIYAAQEYEIHDLLGTAEGEEEEDFHWMAETGVIGAVTIGAKNLAKVGMRLALEPGKTLRLYAQYDSIGGWHEIGRVKSKSLKAFTMPVKMQRCDHLRLRLEGDGECVMYAIQMVVEGGSELGKTDSLVLDF